jgi:sugar transferase (PEP-CTERM/EpsH1 system associated)
MGARRLRILFVTFGLPYPPDSGARMHDFYLIKHVGEHHDVTVLSLITEADDVEHLASLSQYCDRVEVVEARRRSLREAVKGIGRHLRAGFPLATYPFVYDEMMSKLSELVAQDHVDVVQIEHSFLAPYVEANPADGRCRSVLSFHNLGVRQYRRMVGLQTGSVAKALFVLKWLMMRGWEARYAERFDHCIVVSPVEKELLQSANPTLAISTVENGVDVRGRRPLPEALVGNDLLFVGTMGYPPNADAVLYFCRSILPLIRREIPNVRLIVVGHAPTSKVRSLAEQDDVVVTGSVPDVIPYYQQARVAVVPLRGGGGTRLKILEAMALGRPVVSTSLGCEGLRVVDREHIMMADTPTEFAARVIELLADARLRRKLTINARSLVEAHYDWEIISQKLLALYRGLTFPASPANETEPRSSRIARRS